MEGLVVGATQNDACQIVRIGCGDGNDLLGFIVDRTLDHRSGIVHGDIEGQNIGLPLVAALAIGEHDIQRNGGNGAGGNQSGGAVGLGALPFKAYMGRPLAVFLVVTILGNVVGSLSHVNGAGALILNSHLHIAGIAQKVRKDCDTYGIAGSSIGISGREGMISRIIGCVAHIHQVCTQIVVGFAIAIDGVDGIHVGVEVTELLNQHISEGQACLCVGLTVLVDLVVQGVVGLEIVEGAQLLQCRSLSPVTVVSQEGCVSLQRGSLGIAFSNGIGEGNEAFNKGAVGEVGVVVALSIVSQSDGNGNRLGLGGLEGDGAHGLSIYLIGNGSTTLVSCEEQSAGQSVCIGITHAAGLIEEDIAVEVVIGYGLVAFVDQLQAHGIDTGLVLVIAQLLNGVGDVSTAEVGVGRVRTACKTCTLSADGVYIVLSILQDDTGGFHQGDGTILALDLGEGLTAAGGIGGCADLTDCFQNAGEGAGCIGASHGGTAHQVIGIISSGHGGVDHTADGADGGI